MKSKHQLMKLTSLIAFLFFLTSCGSSSTDSQEKPGPAKPMVPQAIEQTLPVKYQQPSYAVDLDSKEDLAVDDDDIALKTGIRIRSKKQPLPLWKILKDLASHKKMNVSWASDVDQNVLVDVDISPNDNFYESIENLLRQVSFFHEVHGNTIVVHFKETKQYHVAMPFIKQNYSTGVGGNVLGSNDASSNIDGTIALKSSGNEFDFWQDLQNNMDAIMDAWNLTVVTPEEEKAAAEDENVEEAVNLESKGTRQRSSGKSFYIIDKPVGIITVVAPRAMQIELENYFNTLNNSLYRQVSIEAKIIEVHLSDNSSIGINWNQVLNNFAITGDLAFGGVGGQIFPYIFANDQTYNDGTNHGNVYDPTRFVSKVSINTANFGVFLNALKEQGDTKVLSNPKISVLNGQPAMITVGRNVTYIESIDVDIDTDTGLRTYTATTERILSGVGLSLTATILNGKELILNLVPVTSELEEPIEYKDVGRDGGQVGLPVVNVREMSTTVRVKNGEMLVIGGLISSVDDTQGNFAPVVGQIPLIRYLFGYEEKVKTKRELIVLLKPRIIF